MADGSRLESHASFMDIPLQHSSMHMPLSAHALDGQYDVLHMPCSTHAAASQSHGVTVALRHALHALARHSEATSTAALLRLLQVVAACDAPLPTVARRSREWAVVHVGGIHRSTLAEALTTSTRAVPHTTPVMPSPLALPPLQVASASRLYPSRFKSSFDLKRVRPEPRRGDSIYTCLRMMNLNRGSACDAPTPGCHCSTCATWGEEADDLNLTATDSRQAEVEQAAGVGMELKLSWHAAMLRASSASGKDDLNPAAATAVLPPEYDFSLPAWGSSAGRAAQC